MADEFKEGDKVELTIIDCAYIGDPPKQIVTVRKNKEGELLFGSYIADKCLKYYSPRKIKE